ncbi:MAG: chloramphenicol phosphotransferase CPT family protein [Oscillospiraceae bacterium]|jgi:chloramphenicol 3-O-phosphotransferase|nr:chloramphenicol phosphotransferase CPT family protein [Oscillospiraceae bacterium]
MQRGRIIVLNGVSSAGKTTLARVLQARMPQQYLYLPIDLLNDISPPKDSPSYPERFTADPMPIVTGFFGCIKSFADYGINIIADLVLAQRSLGYFLSVFPDGDYPVMMVHVTCPLDELRRREKARGDRKIGHGESQLAALMPREGYDLVVDTHAETNEVNADRIIDLSRDFSEFKLFQGLWMGERKYDDIYKR